MWDALPAAAMAGWLHQLIAATQPRRAPRPGTASG